MTTEVHGTAIVREGAQLGNNVSVGPYSIIGENVRIGDGTVIGSNALIDGNTVMGKNNRVYHGAVIGSPPQDLKYRGARSYVRIGDNNIFREFVTVNSATDEGDSTVIGDQCLLMAYVHVAHDCIVKDNVILANAVNLAGHVTIHEYATLGGIVPVHQFVRIGTHAFIGGGSRIAKDVPPYIKVAGNPPLVSGLNLVGLRRRGFGDEQIEHLKKVYKLLFRNGLNVSQALEKIERDISSTPETKVLINFIRSSQRGITL
jgi:UDP-N-acetylglucosamine acyltransferase